MISRLRDSVNSSGLWEGHVELVVVCEMADTVADLTALSSVRGSASARRLGALVVTDTLFYILEFVAPSDPKAGHRLLAEDVIECLTTLVVYAPPAAS